MEERIICAFESRLNARNTASCTLYADRVVLRTNGGGWNRVYNNKERVIPLHEIKRVVISRGGIRFFIHHPNCIHFVTAASRRTVDEMFRDPSFHACDYISDGVCQFSPKTQAELDEKIEIAVRMKAWIEEHRQETPGRTVTE